MKKKLVMVIGMLLTIGLLSGCGPEGEVEETGGEVSSEESRQDTESSPAESAKPAQEKEPEQEQEEIVVEELELSEAGSIEETVLYDENDIRITATEIEYSGYKVNVNLLIENNSAKDYSFISGSVAYSFNSVNGYMVDYGYMNVDVAAGKKANDTIGFDRDELLLYGITQIADIQIGIGIVDSDYKCLDVVSGKITTSLAESYDYSEDTFKNMLHSGVLGMFGGSRVVYFEDGDSYHVDGLRILSEACLENKNGEPIVCVEVSNDTDKLVYGALSHIRMNGLDICSSAYSNMSISPGCKRLLYFLPENLLKKEYADLLGMGKIGRYTFDFVVKDEEYKEIREPVTMEITIDAGNSEFANPGQILYDDAGIRIFSAGVMEDPASYSDDIHWLIIVENDTEDEIRVDDKYDSLSVNGFMTDSYVMSVYVEAGGMSLLDISMEEDSLKKNKIESAESITEAEITFEIRNEGWKITAEPKIAAAFQ